MAKVNKGKTASSSCETGSFKQLRESNPFKCRQLQKEDRLQAKADEAAAATLSKMAKVKKGEGTTSLQVEIENDQQWHNMIRREGLIVVDVYSNWAGPCTSMVNILKRVKVEINDDRFWLAVASSDIVTELKMFRDQSEPCWLFVAGGKPVKVVRGCNAPLLVKEIKSAFENEMLCIQGKRRRRIVSIDEEAIRRKTAENEAIALAQMLKEDNSFNLSIDDPRCDSSKRLMKATEMYTVLAIQTFLLETGAVTEIRDSLTGEFSIVQERCVNLSQENVRQLFHIPLEIVDPNQPEEADEEEVDETENPISESIEGQQETQTNGADETNPEVVGDQAESIANEDDEDDSEKESVKVKKKIEKPLKMLPVDVPEDIIGDTLILLLESRELRTVQSSDSDEIHADDIPLHTADDHIQVKVGPSDLNVAKDSAPTSLHAIYGKGQYISGVWCSRDYTDKQFVMINFFPRFVTEMLIPLPSSSSLQDGIENDASWNKGESGSDETLQSPINGSDLN